MSRTDLSTDASDDDSSVEIRYDGTPFRIVGLLAGRRVQAQAREGVLSMDAELFERIQRAQAVDALTVYPEPVYTELSTLRAVVLTLDELIEIRTG